jgi:hypothetical protein
LTAEGERAGRRRRPTLAPSLTGATLAGLQYRFGRFCGYWPPAHQAAVMGALAYEFVVPQETLSDVYAEV